MGTLSKHGDPWFHLQGGAVLGATAGLFWGAGVPPTLALAAVGAGALAFAFWFRGSLWPLLSKRRLYESLFGISGPDPVTYIKEGVAAGVIAGSSAGLALSSSLASLLVWAGLALLVLRYADSVRCLFGALRGALGGSESAYGRLLISVRGNRELAERLIAYEGRCGPPGSREDLAERALERLLRDRR